MRKIQASSVYGETSKAHPPPDEMLHRAKVDAAMQLVRSLPGDFRRRLEALARGPVNRASRRLAERLIRLGIKAKKRRESRDQKRVRDRVKRDLYQARRLAARVAMGKGAIAGMSGERVASLETILAGLVPSEDTHA